MSVKQVDIIEASEELHQWAATWREDYRNKDAASSPNHRIWELESGAMIINLVATMPEEDSALMELFFPSRPDAFPIVSQKHDGFLRPVPRRLFPQVVASVVDLVY